MVVRNKEKENDEGSRSTDGNTKINDDGTDKLNDYGFMNILTNLIYKKFSWRKFDIMSTIYYLL